MCEVLCVILCGVIWTHVRESIFGLYYSQRRGSHCHRVLLTFLSLSYLLDVCSRLPVAGGLRFIVYRIIFDAPCIVLNIWCGRDDIIGAAYRRALSRTSCGLPQRMGDLLFGPRRRLVVKNSYRRCGRCMVYTDRYAVFHADGANLKICTFFAIGLHNFIISIFRVTLYIETS